MESSCFMTFICVLLHLSVKIDFLSAKKFIIIFHFADGFFQRQRIMNCSLISVLSRKSGSAMLSLLVTYFISKSNAEHLSHHASARVIVLLFLRCIFFLKIFYCLQICEESEISAKRIIVQLLHCPDSSLSMRLRICINFFFDLDEC